jgi:hypothetical protein
MGFIVFFFLSWLIVSIFAVIQKRLSIVENTMIFLIIFSVNIHFSWIIIEELRLIKLSNKGFNYTAFLLNRSVIIPFIMVILINLLQWSKTIISKCLLIFYSVVLLLCFSNLSSFFDIIDFKKWNYGFEAIYFLLLALVAISATKLFRRFSRNEVNLS